MRAQVSIIVTLALLPLSACSIPRLPATPTATVRNVSLVKQTDQGAKIEAVVLLSNPNATPLPLVEYRYSLKVDGGGSFEGADQVHRTLPASARQAVHLPAAFATEGMDLRGASYTIDGSISYRPPGQLRKLMTESKIPLPCVHFQANGQLE